MSELKGRDLRRQGEHLLNALDAALKINETLSEQFIKTMVKKTSNAFMDATALIEP